MQLQYIHEVLRLLLLQCKNKPEIFTAIFNQSDSLIGYNYSNTEKRFTHVSNSFRKLLGYNKKNMLNEGVFDHKIIHPHDKSIFVDYFNIQDIPNDTESHIEYKKIKRLKCRAKHMRGYWKYLIFFSMNYWNETSDSFDKIGLIANEHTKPEHQMLARNIDYLPLDNITFKRKPFIYDTNDIHISQRESEILELIGEGQIAKEIASQLNISPNTVITHRKNLISKFHVRNTAQLIKKASQLMLI